MSNPGTGAWNDAEGAGGGALSPSARLGVALEAERARWFYWIPVIMGAGIATYFALPSEPPAIAATLLMAGALGLRMALPRTTLLSLATSILVIFAVGFALITLRTLLVAGPVLQQRMGPVEVRGYVELVEPREGRGERITLRITKLGQLDHAATPQRARIRTMKKLEGLAAGDAITARVHLAPPAGPALPGGFDFARHAYFSGIGAVGYALMLPERDASAGPAPFDLRVSASVQRLRQAIGARVDRVLSGETAAIAKALITGERGGIPEATNAAYRDSGLFHILSISGLHMAVMGGAVFFSVRLLLALFPTIALRFAVKKWAALAAAFGSLCYLAISGTSFATVRSFIMISIMFLAVLLDRPAVALRNVALSALVILALFPESVLDVGFQMSFAAVVALVAAYEAVRDRLEGPRRTQFGIVMRTGLFFGGIILSTLVASAAVTPFAIYHFHKSQQFAIIANLLAIPICNLMVMPAALATLVAMPLGLEAGPLWVMGLGIDAMSWTARQVARLPGAVGYLPAIPTAAFALMLAGGLWLLLWHARWRFLGLAGIAAGIALAPLAPRPDVLIGRDGALVAVRTESGRLTALAAPQSRFELSRWLEHDGDSRPPAEVFASGGMSCDALGCMMNVKGVRIVVSRHPAAIGDDCRQADLVVLAMAVPKGCSEPAAVVDFFAARTAGTHAVYISGPREFRIETVARTRGARPWSPPHPWSPEGRRSAAVAAAEGAARSITSPAGTVITSPAGVTNDGTDAAAATNSGNSRYGRRSERGDRYSRVAAFAAPIAMLDALRLPRPEVEDDAEPLLSDEME